MHHHHHESHLDHTQVSTLHGAMKLSKTIATTEEGHFQKPAKYEGLPDTRAEHTHQRLLTVRRSGRCQPNANGVFIG